jgi:murein DD-endopeptidase MepM/ murein hydrolase activator NlpD
MMHSTLSGVRAGRHAGCMRLFLLALWLTGAAAGGARAAAPTPEVEIAGDVQPGALIRGRTAPGNRVRMNGRPLSLDDEGYFIFGLGRDASGAVRLEVTAPDGAAQIHSLAIRPRAYDVQCIDGLPQGKVTPDQAALDRIAREQKSIDAARARRSDTRGYRAQFRWPVKGRISGVYGSQRILNGVAKNPHAGLDIAAPTGTPILAPAAGHVVLAAADLYYSGNTVIVDHGLGLSSTLIHMSRMSVAVGDRVQAGDKLGEVGMTGRATGPHLHWGINWLDQRLDPQLLLEE